MRNGVDVLIVAITAVYCFLVGFVLAICVFMNSSDESAMRITYQHPIRSIALTLLVAWPFLTMCVAGRRALWKSVAVMVLCLGVATVGMVCATSDQGAFEDFSGTGALRRGTGKVYLISSLVILALNVYRALAIRCQTRLAEAEWQ